MSKINNVGAPGKKGAANFRKVKLNNPRGTLKRLLAFMKPYTGRLILVVVFCVFTTLFMVVSARFNGTIIDEYIDRPTVDMVGLIKVCLLLAAMYLLYSGISYVQSAIMVRIGQDASVTLRSTLFSKVQRLPLQFYDTNSSGDIMSRLTNDIDNINMALSQNIVQLISGLISLIGILAAMLITSWQLTLVGLLTTPVLFVLMRLIIKVSQPIFVKQQALLGDLNGYVEESISGQKAVILFSRQKKSVEEFSVKNHNLTRTAILAQSLSGLMGPINNMIGNIGYLVVCIVGSAFTIKQIGGVTIGIMFTFVIYLRNFNRPLSEIFNILNALQQALAGAERVFEVLDKEEEKDKEGAIDITNVVGHVEMKDVCFSYTPEKQVLKNMTLSAPSGSTIAIVGKTGAGKTTIINLLTKFYHIDSGSITLDGVDIENITAKSLRENISVVLQDTFLFSASIKDNLRYARLDATDEEVEAAAKLANAHSFISKLPEGYDTVLDDNGSNISQGQRQLLAIARAILANSALLILDEATSSIDTKTEVDIQRAMLNLMKGKTSFVIAHRLSTIKNADNILVIDDGKLIEQGNHEALLALNGTYAGLYASQFSEET